MRFLLEDSAISHANKKMKNYLLQDTSTFSTSLLLVLLFSLDSLTLVLLTLGLHHETLSYYTVRHLSTIKTTRLSVQYQITIHDVTQSHVCRPT